MGRIYMPRPPAGFVIVAISWLIFFTPLAVGQVHFSNDIKKLYYPLETAYLAFQQQGVLPQWSPWFGFGHPLLAWGQLGFLTPIHLALRALAVPSLRLLQFSMVIYYALGALGWYRWLRQHKLQSLPAGVGAAVFTFGGWHAGHLTHVNFYVATMLLPWLLLNLHSLLTRPRLRSAAWSGLLAGTIMISGHLPIAAHTVVAALAYVVIWILASHMAHWLPPVPGRRLLPALGLAASIAILLSTITVWPLAEWWPLTDRAQSFPTEELYEFSYPPWHALTLVAPYFFGSDNLYWGAKNFAELSLYVGIIPLMLAGISLVGGASRRRHGALWLWATGLTVGGAALALGKYSPLYRALVTTGVMTAVGVPARFLFFTATGVAVLAALGLEHLSSDGRPRLKSMRLGAAVAPSALLVLLAFYLTTQSWSWAQVVTVRNLWAAGLALVGGAVVAWCMARPSFRSLFTTALATAATLLAFGWSYNPLTPAAQAMSPSPFADTLMAYEAEHHVPARVLTRLELTTPRDPLADTPITKTPIRLRPIAQPIRTAAPLACVHLRLEATTPSDVTVAVATAGGEPITSTIIRSSDVTTGWNRACFPGPGTLPEGSYVLLVSSDADSPGPQVIYAPTVDSADGATTGLGDNPDGGLSSGGQSGRLVVRYEYDSAFDEEQTLLAPQLQTAATSSTAGWIGSLGHADFLAFLNDVIAFDRPLDDPDRPGRLDSRRRALLDMAGITHLIQALPHDAPDPLPDHGFKVIEAIPLATRTARLYENQTVLPKAYLTANTTVASDAQSARARLKSLTVPGTAVVHGPQARGLLGLSPRAGRAAIKEFSPHRVTILTEATQETLLVLTELTTPQWYATLDGQSAPIVPTQSIFRGVYVPPGQHEIIFRYYSPALARALRAAGVGLALSLAALAWPSRLDPLNHLV